MTQLTHGCHKYQPNGCWTEMVASPLNPCPSYNDMLPQISPFHQVPHPAIP
jgi:hypothetical protein